jgi:phenylalanine-4-hydroxylase
MGIGEQITSVYAGVADPESWELKLTPPMESTHKIQYSDKEKELLNYYGKIRNLTSISNHHELENLIDIILNKYPKEWLLLLEAYEFILSKSEILAQKIKGALSQNHFNERDKKLIEFGLGIL